MTSSPGRKLYMPDRHHRRAAQLNFRRGWLQSAGMLEYDDSIGVLVRTEAGSLLLGRLENEPPLT